MQTAVCAQKNALSQEDSISLTRKFINAEKERQLGNLEASVDLFNQCLSIAPDHDASYFGLGKIYLEQKMLDEAEKNFQKAANVDEKNKWYWLSLAQVMLEREKYKDASKIYATLSKRYPKNAQLQLDYANTLLYAGKERKAMKAFDEFEATAGVTEEVTRRKYQYFIKKEKYDEAAEEVEKLLDAFPGDNQLYGMLAELYKARGEYKKAINVYKKALELDPHNPYIQLSLSEFYDKVGEKEKSYKFLKEAYENSNLDIDTKVGVLIKMFGEAERYPKVRQEALELCKAVVETHPEQAKSYSVYGDYLSLDNQRDKARGQYRKAVKIDPSRYAIWNQILLIDSELGMNDSLIADSKAAMEYFPAQPMVYLFNGIANNQAENYEAAAKSLKQGAQMVLGNNQLSAQMLASLGDAYHELGRHESSDSAYDASLSYDPE
ncbi:MAG: tetratricopeptide repeat protein, partial [Salibacteraceae bacterium]